jgi:hypothetical protein
LLVVDLFLKSPKKLIIEKIYLIKNFYFFLKKFFILRTTNLNLIILGIKKILKLKKRRTKKKNKNILFTTLKLNRNYLIYNKLTSTTKYFKNRLNTLLEFKKLTILKYHYVIPNFYEHITFKKALGSRMGKGRGTLKLFYLQIPTCLPFLTLSNANPILIMYLYKNLKKKNLPLIYYRYIVFRTNLS